MLKVILIEGLQELICHSIRLYWGSKKRTTVHNLVCDATSLRKIQRELHSTDMTGNNEKLDNQRNNGGHKSHNVINIRASGFSSLPFLMISVHCVSNTNCPDSYAIVASTAAAHITIVFFAITNDYNGGCPILSILSCVESPYSSMSSHSYAAPRLAHQHT